MIRVTLERTAFEPGSELQGHVEWRAQAEKPPAIAITLLWFTAGKGTEDAEIVDQVDVASPQVGGRYDFTFILPEFPWSFSGELISLIWAIEAGIEPDGAVDRVEFVSAPEAEEILL